MARTKSYVNSAYSFNLANHKSKRHQLKIIARKGHHALRNANRQTDELSFTIFRPSSHRIYYEYYQEEREIFNAGLGKFSEQLHRDGKENNQSMRKRLQDEIRKIKREQAGNNRVGGKVGARTVSDVFIAAHKRFQRRESIKMFKVHREKGSSTNKS